MERSKKVDKDGRISVFDLRVPLFIALGLFERVEDEKFADHARDVAAELKRRKNG